MILVIAVSLFMFVNSTNNHSTYYMILKATVYNTSSVSSPDPENHSKL